MVQQDPAGHGPSNDEYEEVIEVHACGGVQETKAAAVSVKRSLTFLKMVKWCHTLFTCVCCKIPLAQPLKVVTYVADIFYVVLRFTVVTEEQIPLRKTNIFYILQKHKFHRAF